MYHDLYLGEKALVEREKVGFDLTKSDLCSSFVEDLTMKGMGLRVADSHTGNHHEDGFTPLETIRRLLSIIWEKILFELEGIPSIQRERFVGLYTHYFTLSNLRIPISSFICEVLNYFKVHIFRFNPFGMVKLTTFAVICKAYGGELTVDLLRSFLNLSPAGDWLTLLNRGGAHVPKALTKPITHLERWKGLKTSWKHSPKKPVIYYRRQEIDFISFMIQEVDGEFNFLHEGGLDEDQSSLSVKSVYNKISMINAEPISVVHPLNVAKNVIDSGNASHENDELNPVGLSKPHDPKAGNTSKAAGKRKHAVVPLMLITILISMLNPKFPLYKSLSSPFVVTICLRDISLEQLCDIHDMAYMREAVLDNVKKDKAYAELEKKCNEALQDFDKNPLVSDMRSEIETLQGQVNGLHNEYRRLVLEEKKWVNYEQTLSILRAKFEGLESEREKLKVSEVQLLQEIDSLKHDRAAVITKVVLDAVMKLIQSDEMGILIAKYFNASMFRGRCATFEEVANLKGPFILEKMLSYRLSSKQEFNQACDDLANASYPFLAELAADPYASVEQLLSKKPQSL
ncbi:hypothetical protein Tco_0039150 [Tanacetum coccineum]